MTFLFNPYKSTPSTKDKNFINTRYGGYSNCIVRDKSNGYTLPNCVAFVHGMWLSTITEAKGLEEAKRIEHDMCWGNAEAYWDYTEDGFKRGQTPKLNAIMVWEGHGSLAGHVMIVTSILDNGDVIGTGSDYSGAKFYTRRYYKSQNFNFSPNYTFKGFIYCPFDFVYKVGNPDKRDVRYKQIEVLTDTLRVRQDASTKKWPEGYCNKGIYFILGEAENEGYKWYKIGSDMWIANDKNETWCKILPSERIGKPVARNEKVDQFEVTATTLNARKEPSLKGEILGYASKGIFNCVERKEADGYKWFKSDEGFWVAQAKDGKDWVTWLPKTIYFDFMLKSITENQKNEMIEWCKRNSVEYEVTEIKKE